MWRRMIFNYKFFELLNDKKEFENGAKSLLISLIIYIFQLKAFIICLSMMEFIITRLLVLPIPIYSDLVLMTVTNIPGLPRLSGCYIRGLYYKGLLKKMEHNVIIEQGVHIAHPECVELSEFSFIDKNVILGADKCKVGRRVHIASNVMVTGGGEFEIEDYACIANGSTIITATETLKNGTRSSGPMLPSAQRDVLRGFVKISKDAFISTQAIIFTNVTIAEGTVVGSNTVITKDTKPWKFYIQKGGKTVILKNRKKLILPDV